MIVPSDLSGEAELYTEGASRHVTLVTAHKAVQRKESA